MRTFSALLTMLLTTALLGGCATHKATINTFTDAAYTESDVESLAIFPIRNTRAAPAEAQSLTRTLAQTIHGDSPNLDLVGPGEASRALNEADLAETYARFVEDFALSGIANTDYLSEVGDALEVDAIMQGEVVRAVQEDGDTSMFGGSKGTTRVTVRFVMLDTDDGRLLWEASSDGIRKTALNGGDAPPVIEAVELAMEKIIQNLPPL